MFGLRAVQPDQDIQRHYLQIFFIRKKERKKENMYAICNAYLITPLVILGATLKSKHSLFFVLYFTLLELRTNSPHFIFEPSSFN